MSCFSNPVNRQTDSQTDTRENITCLAEVTIRYALSTILSGIVTWCMPYTQNCIAEVRHYITSQVVNGLMHRLGL